MRKVAKLAAPMETFPTPPIAAIIVFIRRATVNQHAKKAHEALQEHAFLHSDLKSRCNVHSNVFSSYSRHQQHLLAKRFERAKPDKPESETARPETSI